MATPPLNSTSKPKKSALKSVIQWTVKLGFTLGLFLLIFRPEALGICTAASPFRAGDISNPAELARRVAAAESPVEQFIQSVWRLPGAAPERPMPELAKQMSDGLNQIRKSPDLYSDERFAGVELTDQIRGLLARGAKGKNLLRLNRRLLEAAFPGEIIPARKPLIQVTPGELWREIKGVQARSFIPWIIAAILIKAFGIGCSIMRWRLLLIGQGIRLPAWHLLSAFLVGRFFGMPLPGTLGLDGYRLYDVGKHTGKWIESATVIAVEKLIGFVALTFLVFITLPLGMSFLDFKPAVLGVLLLILGSFIAVSFSCLLRPKILQVLIAILPVHFWPKLESKFSRLAQAVTAYSGQRKLLMGAVACGFLVHLSTSLMYFCTAMAIRTVGVTIGQILFASPIMIYASVIGPSVSGEGIREAVFMMLLGAQLGDAKTFLFSHLGLWTGEWTSVIGGIILMARSASYKPTVSLSSLSRTGLSPLPTLGKETIRSYRLAILAAVSAACLGGMIGGGLTGLLDGAYVVAMAEHLDEWWAIAYGWIAHSLLGLGAGCGIAGLVVFCVLWRDKPWARRRVFGFAAGAAFASIGFVFMRHRFIRDFLDEQRPSLSDTLHLALIAALGFAILRYALSGAARLRAFRWIAGFWGGLALYAIVTAALLIIGVLQWTAAPGYVSPKAPAEDAPQRPSVLLIVIDTLRADHLDCYGSQEVSTPNISALARDGILFGQAIAQASWTRPSIATILTGLYPSTHGAVTKSDKLIEEKPTLAEHLQSKGVYTSGLVNNSNIAEFHGFAQGFDNYTYLPPKAHFWASESATRLVISQILRKSRHKILSRGNPLFADVYDFYWPAGDIVNRASERIDAIRQAPFFFFAHFMDPHDPYMLHPLENKSGYARLAWEELSEEQLDPVHQAYRREIEYTDAHLGKLFAHLKDQGLYDELAIILTADHGEEFLEHGGWWHGRTLYDEQLRVPLIVKLPNQEFAGQSKPYQVRLLDIAPTICRIMGMEPPRHMQGVPLLQDGRPVDPELSMVFSEEDFEGNVLQSARGLEWKMHRSNPENPRGLPPLMLFHLATDSGEQRNVQDENAKQAADMAYWAKLSKDRALMESGSLPEE